MSNWLFYKGANKMDVQNLPELVKEFGFFKMGAAIRRAYDADRITKSDALRLLDLLRKLYAQQIGGFSRCISAGL
jgi:hypothetical protein